MDLNELSDLWEPTEMSEDDDSYDGDNLGTVPCECGGDICVCNNNGEEPCPDCDRGW